MYGMHLRDMATRLKKAGLISNEDKATQIMREYWTDRIAVSWTTSDVLDRAEQKGITLSEDKAKEILQTILRRHDAEIGINWDVIDANIDMYNAKE